MPNKGYGLAVGRLETVKVLVLVIGLVFNIEVCDDRGKDNNNDGEK